MALGNLEIHFSTINRTATETTVKARIYSVVTTGTDALGSPILQRTLETTKSFTLPPQATDADIVVAGRSDIAAVNTALGLGFTSLQFICSLGADSVAV
jgi:hypothetical protein